MSEDSSKSVPSIKQENMDDGGKASSLPKPLDLDDVLVNELGQFGWFQLRNILLVSVPIVMSAFMTEYIFSSAPIPHRCRIPECGEDGKMHEFEPEWILNAIPETSSGFSSCERFVPVNLDSNRSLDNCPAIMFDQSATVACDGFVYKRNNTVVYEFDLGCQDWLRALAGTLKSIGTLLVLPITGYISDRFGRRIALVINMFNLAFIGLIRAFSVNYTMYLVLQITQTTLGAGTFSSAYVFGAELVGPKYRVLTNAITSSMFSVGQIILGTVAWLIPSWRYMIIVLHIPCFLIISYYWILTDSVRWLLSKGKFTEAKKVLETVARVNKTCISEKSMEALTYNSELSVQSSDIKKTALFRSIIRSPTLLRRVCTTPIWWVTATCVYYGLSINSINLSDTMHLNYIMTTAIEIPGSLATIFVLDKVGRKATLSCSFFFSSLCNIVFVFISNELYALRFAIFLLGKFCISIAMAALYLYTSELYPTEYRHSLLAFSSMIGRIGHIVAPLTPVLANYWHGTPSMLFGIMGIISGILVFTQPDTTGTKLPDTLAQAEAVGQKVQS